MLVDILVVYIWGHLRKFAARVDGLALAVEVLVTHAVGVVVAAVGVTLAREAVLRVRTTAVAGLADVVFVVSTSMRGQGKRVRVGFPDPKYQL